MSFAQSGFLSEDMQSQIDAIRREHSTWFGLGNQLNGLGQRIILAKPGFRGPTAKHRIIGLMYATRAVSCFQSILLLAERGMIVEANTLTRSLIETTWILAGLAKDREAFVEKLKSADYAERKATGNWYMGNPRVASHVEPENIAKMKAFIEKLDEREDDLQKLILGNVAADTNLVEMYAIYRHLSHHFAHPSLTAAAKLRLTSRRERYCGSSRYGIKLVGETLAFACNVMFAALLSANQIAPADGVLSELTDLFPTFVTLAEKSSGVKGDATVSLVDKE